MKMVHIPLLDFMPCNCNPATPGGNHHLKFSSIASSSHVACPKTLHWCHTDTQLCRDPFFQLFAVLSVSMGIPYLLFATLCCVVRVHIFGACDSHHTILLLPWCVVHTAADAFLLQALHVHHNVPNR